MGSSLQLLILCRDGTELTNVAKTAANFEQLNADPSAGFVVGGVSAGGNVAAVLAHLARDDKLSPPLTGQILIIPTVLDVEVVPQKYQAEYLSQEQNKDAPFIPKPVQDMFMGRLQSLLISRFAAINSYAHTFERALQARPVITKVRAF